MNFLSLFFIVCGFASILGPTSVLASADSDQICFCNPSGIPSLLEFSRYTQKFHKNYNPAETLRRAKIFLARTLEVFKHNVLFAFGRSSYFLVQNQFTDVTPEEEKTLFTLDLGPKSVAKDAGRFKRQVGEFMFMDDFVNPFDSMSGLRDGKSTGDWTIGDFIGSVKKIYDMVKTKDKVGQVDKVDEGKNSTSKNIGASPKKKTDHVIKCSVASDLLKFSVDWRKSDCLNGPKVQGNCNSCYAHAMLDVLEFHHCRQTKKLTQFSSQYVIDCGYKTGLMGCKGGKLGDLARFIRLYGLELEEAYKYLDREGTCPYSKAQDEQKVSGPIRVSELNLYQIEQIEKWDEWLRRSPLIVGINMPSDFLSYGGGLHDGSNCLDDMVHAMVLVGSGTEDGKPFWLLRNTFSDAWGEDGYMRLSKNAPRSCFYVAAYVKPRF